MNNPIDIILVAQADLERNLKRRPKNKRDRAKDDRQLAAASDGFAII